MKHLKKILIVIPVLVIFVVVVAVSNKAKKEKAAVENLEQVKSRGEFTSPKRVEIKDYKKNAMEPFISLDGKYLFFNNLNNSKIDTNLHYAEKVDDTTFQYIGEVEGVNTASLEGVPSMDEDGNFYFVSPRSYDKTFATIYKGIFENGKVSGVDLVSGTFAKRKPPIVNMDVAVSPDGEYFYYVESEFALGESGGLPKKSKIGIAKRSGDGFDKLKNSDKLMKKINTEALEYAPAISRDGLELYFTRADNPTGKPVLEIYKTVRGSIDKPFEMPALVSSIQGFVEAPTLTKDENTMYYHKKENDTYVIYKVSR